MMASNEEIADDAALAGQADAFSIGDAIRWLKLGQQRRSSGDVREQAEASAMLESATQGGYMRLQPFARLGRRRHVRGRRGLRQR